MILKGDKNMFECPNCEYEVDENNLEYECPYCGEYDELYAFVRCENCETLFTESGDYWECENCHNEGISKPKPRFIDYDDYDDDYCDDGIPDVNQGWLGENYG